jgi:hypothetical protein
VRHPKADGPGPSPGCSPSSCCFLDKIVLGLVAVPMMDELGLTPKQFGDVGSGFFWLFAISGVLGGFLDQSIS